MYASVVAANDSPQSDQFMTLYRFISGENLNKKTFQMTVPVIFEASAETTTMSFLLLKLGPRAKDFGCEDNLIFATYDQPGTLVRQRHEVWIRYHG